MLQHHFTSSPWHVHLIIYIKTAIKFNNNYLLDAQKSHFQFSFLTRASLKTCLQTVQGGGGRKLSWKQLCYANNLQPIGWAAFCYQLSVQCCFLLINQQQWVSLVVTSVEISSGFGLKDNKKVSQVSERKMIRTKSEVLQGRIFDIAQTYLLCWSRKIHQLFVDFLSSVLRKTK